MTPRSSKQFEAIRQQRTKDIINAALRLFAQKGYNATSITDIVEEAGIAKGLLYNYFKSKEHLLEEVIIEGFRSCLPPLDDLETRDKTPQNIFRKMLETMRDSFKTNTEFWQLYTRMFIQISQNKRVEEIFLKYSQTFFGQLHELVSDLDKRNTEIETWKLAAQLDGVLLHFVLLQEMSPANKKEIFKPGEKSWPSYPLDEVIESIIQQYTK